MSDDVGNTSDGYHTFNELYEHRHALFIALCRVMQNTGRGRWVWRSRLHSDGSSFDGWFVLGLYKAPGEQITYHLPNRLWDKTDFVKTLDRAPEFDGHSSNDVLRRLDAVMEE